MLSAATLSARDWPATAMTWPSSDDVVGVDVGVRSQAPWCRLRRSCRVQSPRACPSPAVCVRAARYREVRERREVALCGGRAGGHGRQDPGRRALLPRRGSRARDTCVLVRVFIADVAPVPRRRRRALGSPARPAHGCGRRADRPGEYHTRAGPALACANRQRSSRRASASVSVSPQRSRIGDPGGPGGVRGSVRRMGLVDRGPAPRRLPREARDNGPAFFEGWYVKLVEADRSRRGRSSLACFWGSDGRRDEAFVQVLDGTTGRSWYERYDPAEFHAETGPFDVTVGPNRFTRRGRHTRRAGVGLRGQVRFATVHAVAGDGAGPGDHGLVRVGPVMEATTASSRSATTWRGRCRAAASRPRLGGGRGYLEKDWDARSPRATCGCRATTSPRRACASVASIAVIPWRRTKFAASSWGSHPGPDGRASSTSSRLTTRASTTSLAIDDGQVRWSLRSRSGADARPGGRARAWRAYCTRRSARRCTAASRRRSMRASTSALRPPTAGCSSRTPASAPAWRSTATSHRLTAP